MEYRDHEFRYDAEDIEPETEHIRQLSEGKQYSQKRSVHRPKRRKAPKAAHPGCGIGARRNHRWTW